MKKTFLFLIILAILACCLFPPWRRIYKEPNSNIKKFEPVGYGFVAEPPWVRTRIYDRWGKLKDYRSVRADTIDYGRFGVQVGLLLFLGAVIIFSKYIFPPKQKKPKPVPSDIPLPKKRKWVTGLLIVILISYGITVTILWVDADGSRNYLREQWIMERDKATEAQAQVAQRDRIIRKTEAFQQFKAGYGNNKPAQQSRLGQALDEYDRIGQAAFHEKYKKE